MIPHVPWPTEIADQWAAIGVIASVVTAAFAAAGLIGIAILWRQVGAQRQQLVQERQRFRVELSPYLRLDLGPELPTGTWAPPRSDLIDNALTFQDVHPGITADLGAIAAWPGSVDICVWLWNMQSQVSGIADNIEIEVEFEVPDRNDPDVVWTIPFQLTFAYLAAGQRIRYLIASVSDETPFLRGRITVVRYSNMYGDRLSFAHGSAAFSWEGQSLTNERYIFRGEES